MTVISPATVKRLFFRSMFFQSSAAISDRRRECSANRTGSSFFVPLTDETRIFTWSGSRNGFSFGTRTGKEIFHYGPVWGTNNIGEFLAIVHGLALLKQKGLNTMPIYSDSVNAQLWVKRKKCKTTLERNEKSEALYQLIERAENWLKNNTYQNPIVKWPTEEWGEIPADFGRKH